MWITALINYYFVLSPCTFSFSCLSLLLFVQMEKSLADPKLLLFKTTELRSLEGKQSCFQGLGCHFTGCSGEHCTQLANVSRTLITSTRTVHHKCCVTPLSFTFVLVSFVPSKGLTLLKHTNNDPWRHFITFYILIRLTWFFFYRLWDEKSTTLMSILYA